MSIAKNSLRLFAPLVIALMMLPSEHRGTADGAGAFACPNMPTQNPNPPAALGATPSVSFKAGSIIIPMDNCYPRADKPRDSWIEKSVDETYGSAASMSSVLCDSVSDADSAQVLVYGLVHRLMLAGIPVNWSIRGGKTAWASHDVELVSGAGSPVVHMSRSGTTTDPFSSLGRIRYAGGPFIIDEEYAADAITAINNAGADFDPISFHIAKVDFDAPVFKEMGELPKVAVLDLAAVTTQNKLGQLQGSLLDVEMDHLEGTFWNYVDHNEILADDLVDEGYALAWAPAFETITSAAVIAKLEEFAAQGGSLVFHDEGIHAMEGFGSFDTGTGAFTQTQAPMVSSRWAHGDGGLVFNFFSNAYGNDNGLTEDIASDDYSDPASQWGGAGWSGIGGSKFDWTGRCDRGYRDGVRRMVYSAGGGGTDDVEFAAWRHYDNNRDMGRIYYLGGYNWRKNTHSGFRLLMNTVFVDATDMEDLRFVEVGRSAPIIAPVDGVMTKYVGTFESNFRVQPAPVFASMADASGFSFPAVKGHYRGLNLNLVPSGTTEFADLATIPGAVVFDAASSIADMTVSTAGNGCSFPADGGCRRIFTNTGPDGTARTPIVQANAAAVGPLLGFDPATQPDEVKILIQRIHAGVLDEDTGNYVPTLGGVDRSTAAVIEASQVIGVARPTVAYVGGTDGMMHAICVDAVGACPAPGAELWAFLPRTEMSKVARNETRIDGSPKVVDAFGTFGGPVPQFRTVLTFQTGNSNPAATYALDVTDPTNPQILWEMQTTGGGTNIAMGRITLPGSGVIDIAYVQTSSGTATPGSALYAVRTDTGEVVWSWAQPYPSKRSGTSADIPTTAYPGGASVISTNGTDIVDIVLVPTLWGSVMSFNAANGAVNNAGRPLFVSGEDYHPVGAPVSIYRGRDDGVLRAVIVTGGFVDSQSPSASSWAPSNVRQYALSFPLDYTGNPLRESDVLANSALGIFIDFGPGNRAFSQAVIAGNEVFVTTSSEDVNAASYGSIADSGRLFRANLSTSQRETFIIPSGGGSVDVVPTTGTVVTGSGTSTTRTNVTGFDADGGSVIGKSTRPAKRGAWLSK